MLGYGTEKKRYRLYDASHARVIHSRDVLFDKSTRGVEIPRDSEVEVHEEKQENQCVELGSLGDEQHASEKVASSDQSPASGGPENQVPPYSQRERRHPDWYGDRVCIASGEPMKHWPVKMM